MRLVPRLMVLGVVLPVAALVASAAIADRLFHRSLLIELDQRLLAQAATESVSLFDGPHGHPHIHMPSSELAEAVAPMGTELTLLSPTGDILVSSNKNAKNEVMRATVSSTPVFATTAAKIRTLTVGVTGPNAEIYTLHLASPLALVAATMQAFRRTVGLTIVLLAAMLAVILYIQGRRLSRRVEALKTFVPLIQQAEGPPSDSIGGRDELNDLQTTLIETCRSLHQQSVAHEGFLANAAHQLRTPLAVLRTEIDVALRKPREAPELREALQQARDESKRLSELADRLLDFEVLRSQDLQLRPVDPADLVRDVIDRTAASAAKRHVQLCPHMNGSPALVCDPTLVAQAMENLLDNAIRFAPEHSEVQVEVHALANSLQLTVRDSGPGIPPEDQKRVFEPFFTGSTPGSQTGLGLAFVADVARRHGGQAVLRGCEQGTAIGMDLPLQAATG